MLKLKHEFMKNQIVVFYGYVGILFGIITVTIILITEDYSGYDEALLLLLMLFGLLCLLFYLIKTRFWSCKSSELKIIEEENEILKRQIEKAELEEKLKQFNKPN
jgi:hypothetical protein